VLIIDPADPADMPGYDVEAIVTLQEWLLRDGLTFHPFEIVAIDGQPLQPSARYRADTINVGPGQRYDVLWTARKPGKWLIHCHIPHHTTNNNEEVDGGGGLMAIIEVEA